MVGWGNKMKTVRDYKTKDKTMKYLITILVMLFSITLWSLFTVDVLWALRNKNPKRQRNRVARCFINYLIDDKCCQVSNKLVKF